MCVCECVSSISLSLTHTHTLVAPHSWYPRSWDQRIIQHSWHPPQKSPSLLFFQRPLFKPVATTCTTHTPATPAHTRRQRIVMGIQKWNGIAGFSPWVAAAITNWISEEPDVVVAIVPLESLKNVLTNLKTSSGEAYYSEMGSLLRMKESNRVLFLAM